jgi:hypothetical protein
VEHPYPLIEFEAELGDDGVVRIPPALLRNITAGRRVTIRLTNGSVSSALRNRGVTEEEIEKISVCQMEQRENIVGFLKAEGELANRRLFARRAESLLKQ